MSKLFEKHPLPWKYDPEYEQVLDSADPRQWVFKLRRMHVEHAEEAITQLIDALNEKVTASDS